jgi:hypothetical protein
VTTDAWLKLVRRRMAEVDVATSAYTDEELLEAGSDARDWLELKLISGMDALSVDFDPDSADYGFSPEPTLEQAYMLMLRASHELLEQQYTTRLLRGEIGISWRSGLEEESSISAQKAYIQLIDDVASELTELIMIAKSLTIGFRSQ